MEWPAHLPLVRGGGVSCGMSRWKVNKAGVRNTKDVTPQTRGVR